MYRVLILAIASGLVLAACGDSEPFSRNPSDPVDRSGLLRQVSTSEEFEDSLKAGLTAIRETTPADTIANTSRDSFTTTYTQEQNVDEFDVVKYDGEHLFVAPQRGHFGCCFVLGVEDAIPADDVRDPSAAAEKSIRVLSTDPDSGTAVQVGAIALTGNQSVQGLYLEQDRLVALMTEVYWGRFGNLWSDIAVWVDQTTGFAIYDTSDASSPTISFEAQIEGGFIQSRRVGNTVYFITRHTPKIDGLNYYVTSVEDQAANQTILDSVTLEELLPTIRVNGVSSSLIDPLNCYITNDETDPGYPVITSITAVPIDDPSAYQTFCYNEDAYGVYVSESAIYLSQYLIGLDNDATRMHKFAFTTGGLDYRGSADIDGLLWSGGQNDFRISEYNDYVRAVTTQFEGGTEDRIDHHLFILQESASSLALDTVARLPNDSQPEEIGKPNEQLYGVRFFNDRAYAVTFEQIDPLYVIDLADPTQPRISGELEVTGFSDFLHPVSADLLLGLGRSEIGGVKLELFNIADIASPLSLGSETLGGNGSYSEARYDRHAFTYQADVDSIDRFIIPADVYSTDGTYLLQESGLYFYEIHDKATPNLASLVSVGSLITRSSDSGQPWYSGSRNRSILHNDTVFYIRNEEVWATFWTAPVLVNGPF
jgi:hypothetical protein